MTTHETNSKKQATKSQKVILLLSIIVVFLISIIALMHYRQQNTTTLAYAIPEERVALVQELKDEQNHAYRGLVQYLGANENGELDDSIELLSYNVMPNVEYAQLSMTLETFDGSTIDVPAFYYDSDAYSAEWYMSDTYGLDITDPSLVESYYIGEVVEIFYIGVNGNEVAYVFPETTTQKAVIKSDSMNSPHEGMPMED